MDKYKCWMISILVKISRLFKVNYMMSWKKWDCWFGPKFDEIRHNQECDIFIKSKNDELDQNLTKLDNIENMICT